MPSEAAPIECGYRSNARSTPKGEVAVCDIVRQSIGGKCDFLAQVDEATCRFCQTHPPARLTTPNAVVASLIYSLSTEGGNSERKLTQEEVDHLREFALPYLQVASSTSPGHRAPAYERSCLFLGEQIGNRECSGCKGNVTRKVFQCGHDQHESTTITDCRNCPDYDPSHTVGTVSTWAVGLTTAPRKASTLHSTLESLAQAGWPDPLVFAEPGSDEEAMKGKRIARREATLGAWPNWYLGLSELVLRDPHADAYLMCQDDAVFCANLREYLEATLWPAERTGVVSLHTPKHHSRNTNEGFFAQDVGWGAWGAMAYILPNASARALLRDSRIVNHRNRGPREGLVNVDSVVGSWCQRVGLSYHMHAPSLCEHTGATSTLWKKASLMGRRASADFPGDDFDARDCL